MKAEQFIKDYTRNCSNEITTFDDSKPFCDTLYNPWLTPDQALSAVEIAREEIIEWLEDNIDDYLFMNMDWNKPQIRDTLYEDLKKTFKLGNYIQLDPNME